MKGNIYAKLLDTILRRTKDESEFMKTNNHVFLFSAWASNLIVLLEIFFGRD